MTAFRNLKIGSKIIAGYLVALALMLVIGVVALTRLDEVNTNFHNVTGNLAEDQAIAKDVIEQVYRMRLFANRYIAWQAEADLKAYDADLVVMDEDLARADAAITNAERRKMLDMVKNERDNYVEDFNTVKGLIADRAKIQTEQLDVVADLS